MLQLSPVECRVLGVLVEKATTTPEQYPLSVNAMVNGANQKNNRDPVLSLEEREIFDALEGLRANRWWCGWIRWEAAYPNIATMPRRYCTFAPVNWRFWPNCCCAARKPWANCRGRASRMSPLDSLESAKQMLDALMTRTEPFVRELPPLPGSRADRYQQLLCPELHPQAAVGTVEATPIPAAPTAPLDTNLLDRVVHLETELESLRKIVHRLAESLGETV